MKISIVIPAYNEELYIKDCLLSVEKHGTKDIEEVIVIDNGSTDATLQAAEQFPFVTVVSEPKKGASHARQAGLMHAKNELVAFIDADTRITKDWIGIAIDEFNKNKNLVALSGPCVYYDLKPFKSALVSLYFNVFAYPFSKITGSVVLLGNLVIKKSAIMEVGGFDTSIAFYGDDTNIARRLKKVGRVGFIKKFFLYTSGRRLEKEGIIKINFIYVLNHLSEKFFHIQVTKKYLDIR